MATPLLIISVRVKSLIFHVCGCSPRLLNGIDRFHKVMVVFVEPIRIVFLKTLTVCRAHVHILRGRSHLSSSEM